LQTNASTATNRRATGGGTVVNGVFYGGPCQGVIGRTTEWEGKRAIGMEPPFREDLSPEAEE
jgi:hypothetical protein